jgi:hypothetical protein
MGATHNLYFMTAVFAVVFRIAPLHATFAYKMKTERITPSAMQFRISDLVHMFSSATV